MACGDQYKFLAVTSSGYSFEKPYGQIAWSKDYEEWVGLAKRLELQANQHFQHLAEVECRKHGGTGCGTAEASSPVWTKWNALVPLQQQLRQQVDDLPSSWVQWNISEGIQEAMAAVSTALCLMEESDQAIIGYGETPITIPGLVPQAQAAQIPWWIWALVGGGATLVAGAVIYGAVRRSKSARREPPAAKAPSSTASIPKTGTTTRPVARRPIGAANPRSRRRPREAA